MSVAGRSNPSQPDPGGVSGEDRGPRFRDSLIVRIGAVLVLFIGLITAALFLSIEYFVTQQFHALHADNTVRRADEIRLFLEREATHLQRLLELAATDSDLIHSAHYHLNLKGQNNALRQDVERVARTFALTRVQVWDKAGHPVAGSPNDATDAFLDPATRAVVDAAPTRAGWVWQGDGLWGIAAGRLTTTRFSHAYLSVARPLSPLLTTSYPFGSEVVLQRADASAAAPAGSMRIALPDPRGGKTFIDVFIPDTVTAAVGKTQKLLVITLSVGGALLLVAITTYLLRTLRPVHALTGLAAEVGQGRFRTHEQPRGDDEVSRLVRAFNRMVGDIQRLRTLKQRMYQEQQLAAVGKLAAKVAHDINNPLTVIKNLAVLLARQPGADAAAQADLRAILQNCRRCIHIVENLLKFGRPLRLKFEPLDLADFCREALARIAIRLPHAPLRLVEPTGTVRVEADPYQLERVLDNLINNAYQACREEEIVVECGIAPEGAYMAVIDQGKGFSSEALDHLFEPFFTTKQDGNGLGLASCLAIARAHGGDLRITDPGKGHVTLWLPKQLMGDMDALWQNTHPKSLRPGKSPQP